MPPKQEIVITGLGVVSPIGIGAGPFWATLREGRSGIRRVDLPDDPDVARRSAERWPISTRSNTSAPARA